MDGGRICSLSRRSRRIILHNKPLHLTAIPLRSIAAGELGRYNKIKIKYMEK